MAKVKLANLAPGATPLTRGGFIINDTKYGPVAQKWPKKRGKPKTPYDKFRQAEFGIAASMASNPIDLDFICAESTVKGTQLVPRDWLFKCAMGLAYVITLEDGTEYVPFRHVTNNPQYVLEQITQTFGSLLFRGEEFWEGLAPGQNGNVLMLSEGKPSWQPTAIVGGGIAATTLRRITQQSNSSSTNHTVTFEEAILDEVGVWDPANPTRMYIPPTAQKVRFSLHLPGGTTQGNFGWRSAIYQPDNTELKPGTASQVILATNTSWAVNRDISCMGPWIPNPGIEYVTMRNILNTSVAQPFLANTSLTMEVQ